MLEPHLITNNFKFNIIVSLQGFIQILSHRYVPFTKVSFLILNLISFQPFDYLFVTKNDVHSIVICLIQQLCTNCKILDSCWTKKKKKSAKAKTTTTTIPEYARY